jgi:hypothetical protein
MVAIKTSKEVWGYKVSGSTDVPSTHTKPKQTKTKSPMIPAAAPELGRSIFQCCPNLRPGLGVQDFLYTLSTSITG